MRVCTIIARNYWAHARVLTRSVLDHHPDAEVTVLVIDEDASTSDPAWHEHFDVVGPGDIGLDRDELMRMAGIYDVLELSTALKPWLLRSLLAKDREPVIYLDPDIEVFAPIDEIVTHARDKGIVLTPHTISPLPLDGYGPTELTILQAGTYNLGFIAVGSEADGFLIGGRSGCHVTASSRKRKASSSIRSGSISFRITSSPTCCVSRAGTSRIGTCRR